MSSAAHNAKHKVAQWIFDRHMKWRLKELLSADRSVVFLEYPIQPLPRYGESRPPHVKLSSVLSARDSVYRQTLLDLATFASQLERIPEEAEASGQCCWNNIFFSAMDAIALYGILGTKKPARYFEVGSGNSTRFARRAINDLGLATEITSIDPAPRAGIDALCSRVIRQPLESVDTGIFEELQAGDVLFIDNSHCVFQNSDVTVFFLDVLPALKPGIYLHIHDIFLPFDYPSIWVDRHYSEQYLLATHLLANPRTEPILPLAYLSRQEWATSLIDRIWGGPMFQRTFEHYRRLTGGYTGVSFWMVTG
jgi:Methyltransferase domain